jgi:Flp pilus assembly pilin Flp
VSKFIAFWRSLARRESGQALVEYGLILGLVSLVAVVGLTTMAGGVGGLFNTIETLASSMAAALAG